MIIAPISHPSFAFARPHAGDMGVASWSMYLSCGHVCVNQGGTIGTTESKRLDPGLLLGVLT